MKRVKYWLLTEKIINIFKNKNEAMVATKSSKTKKKEQWTYRFRIPIGNKLCISTHQDVVDLFTLQIQSHLLLMEWNRSDSTWIISPVWRGFASSALVLFLRTWQPCDQARVILQDAKKWWKTKAIPPCWGHHKPARQLTDRTWECLTETKELFTCVLLKLPYYNIVDV